MYSCHFYLIRKWPSDSEKIQSVKVMHLVVLIVMYSGKYFTQILHFTCILLAAIWHILLYSVLMEIYIYIWLCAKGWRSLIENKNCSKHYVCVTLCGMCERMVEYIMEIISRLRLTWFWSYLWRNSNREPKSGHWKWTSRYRMRLTSCKT